MPVVANRPAGIVVRILAKILLTLQDCMTIFVRRPSGIFFAAPDFRSNPSGWGEEVVGMVQRLDRTSGIVSSLRASFGDSSRFALALLLLAACICVCIFGAVQASGDASFSIVRSESLDDQAESGEEVSGAADDAPGGEDGRTDSPHASSTSSAAGKTDASPILVDVDGAVHAPGVYELVSDARVRDAIEAAGGLRDDADTSGINQASTVADGSKVHVPARGEMASAAGVASDASSGATSCTNINSASEDELDELPGVGPATAAAIVEERTANGPYASVDDLLRVSGIGEKKLERLRDLVCI